MANKSNKNLPALREGSHPLKGPDGNFRENHGHYFRDKFTKPVLSTVLSPITTPIRKGKPRRPINAQSVRVWHNKTSDGKLTGGMQVKNKVDMSDNNSRDDWTCPLYSHVRELDNGDKNIKKELINAIKRLQKKNE